MSDPLTNMEIQDVLSSIRRLVSEDGRHKTEKKANPAAGHDDEAPAKKLVLTDALRVAEGDGQAADDSTGQGLNGESASLEDTIAELEAAVAGIGGEFEPDGSEVARSGAGESDAALEEAFEDGFPVDVAAEDEETALTRPVTSGQVDAGDEEGKDDAPVATFTRSAATRENRPEAVSEDTGRMRRLHLTAAYAVSDDSSDEDAAPWDRAATAGHAAPRPSTDFGAPVTELGAEEADDAGAAEPIDMNMLRDLVAEIIRDELQGPLGERITRNVRMLVRREISRALEDRGVD